MLEVEMILEPMLDNQKEINLRLLEEIRRIKKEVDALQTGDVESTHAQHNQKDPSQQSKTHLRRKRIIPKSKISWFGTGKPKR